MKCTECGSDLEIGHKFCGECGTTRPQLPPGFEALEQSFLKLRQSYDQGEIEEQQLSSRLGELLVEDKNGDYWAIEYESGQWIRYDGQQWLRGDPVPMFMEEPVPEVEPPPPYVPEIIEEPQQVIEPPSVYVPSKTEESERKSQKIFTILGFVAIAAISIFGYVYMVLMGPSKKPATGFSEAVSLTLTVRAPVVTKEPEPTSTRRPTSTEIPKPTFTRRPATTSMSDSLPLLYYEDFTNPSNEWWTSENPTHTYSYYDNGYRIEIPEEEMITWTIIGSHKSDVVIEADVKNLGEDDNLTALICRSVDIHNFYLLGISSDGYYLIWKKSHNIWITTVDWTSTDAVHTGKSSNRIKAVCSGTNLSLYVNDVLLTTIVDDDFKSGQVGVAAGSMEKPGVDVIFDNFSVYEANP